MRARWNTRQTYRRHTGEKTPSFLRLLPVGFTEKRTDRVEIGHKQTVGQLKTTPPSLGAATKTSQKIKKRWTEMREEKDTDFRSSDSAAQKNGSVGKRVSREPWLFNGAQPNDVQHFLDRLERLWQKDVGWAWHYVNRGWARKNSAKSRGIRNNSALLNKTTTANI